MIRPIVVDDIPWGMSLAHRRYKDIDPGGALIAIGQAMKLPTALAIRSNHGFLVANITTYGWWPERRNCHVLWLCVEEGHPFHACKLLRASVEWAKEQGCKRWWLTSETEHAVASLAERVGARVEPSYVIEFEEGK